MRKAKRWRYYCEHQGCKKSGGSSYHIKKHEDGCTLNPDRICGMCKVSQNLQRPVSALVSALKGYGEDYEKGMEALKELADDCPNCILAAIRQSGLPTCDNSLSVVYSFDYKEAKKEFWDLWGPCDP